MKRIVFNGLPYFTNNLVKNLTSFDKGNKYYFFDTYNSKIDQIKFAMMLPFADLIVSINGVSDYSGSLNLACWLNKKLLMQWQGTDVQLVVERFKNNTINKNYIEKGIHTTDAAWLRDELTQVGINASILPFKFIENIQPLEKFDSIKCYTYFGNGREEYYGWSSVKILAESFPEISFIVVGSEGKNLNKPLNVEFKGWVSKEDISLIQKSHAIFIRYAQHDGYSLSVMEALANGSQVLWNYPHPQTFLCNTLEALKENFEKSIEKIINNQMTSDSHNINWIADNLNKEIVLNNYIKTLNEIAG